MKPALYIFLSLSIAFLIVAGLVLFGPLRYLLPNNSVTNVTDNVNTYFNGGNRPGISPVTGQPINTDPTPISSTPPQSTTWSIPARDGSVIQVLRFTDMGSSTSTEPPSKVVEFAKQPVTGSSTPSYSLTYYPADKSFTLSLLKEPIGEARKAGESDLIKRLGITQGQACILRYVVLTSRAVNSFYSGKNLGFSFCPDAPQF